jgi:aminoglycoside/choline kinase family phosphotransferase
MPSAFPENRAVGNFFNFYEREGRFYQEIGAKLSVRTPRCYWNHRDTEAGTFGLLLEDLTGLTSVDQVAGVGPDRAGQALAALARLHGEWWNSPALDSLQWMPRLDDPINLSAGEQYRQAWPLFVDRVGHALSDHAIALGERVQQCFEDMLITGTAEAPMTICHGDFRGDNLLFDDDATAADQVAVLDWQISYRGPAITDVAYFLCQSVDVEVRRVHEAALVRAWYDAVVESRGGRPGDELDDYRFERAWEHYRRSVLGTTVYPVTAAGSMDPANERGRELLVMMAERAFSAAIQLGSEEFLA